MHLDKRFSGPTWICCQLGAREHYAVPRSLYRRGLLSELITDFWLPPSAASSAFKNGFSDRYHPDLKDASVQSDNLSVAAFELKSRLSGRNGWELIQRRNERYQVFALAGLSRADYPHVNVFAYSYAASKLFKCAKERGWTTVLGQIDPGPVEERLVGKLHAAAGFDHLWKPAPQQYWSNWHLECELADRIVVNSNWSRSALISEGIPATKISVVPLAFEPAREALTFRRQYPASFTRKRPLKVLFLGQVNLRKGVRELLAAAESLSDEPIEFWFVGPVQFEIPDALRSLSSIKWPGLAPRSEVARYYKAADAFVFPTHSDGFGLTQLEAQSWSLPIIVSRNCGEVIKDGVNGFVLAKVDGDEIARTLLHLLRHPQDLQRMSEQSRVPEKCSLAALGASLLNA